MGCARRPAIERLSGGEELVANAAAVVIRLRNAGFDMRAGRDDVRFDAAVAPSRIDWAAAREADDVVRAVRARVGDAAAVGSCLADVFARADGDDVLGRARAADSVGRRPAVAGREDYNQLLIASDAALRVAHDAVISLRVAVVAARGRPGKAPGVARNASALPVSGILPSRPRRAGWAEDRRAAHPRERRDAQAVVESIRVFESRACAIVEAADDVRIKEAVAALRAGLIGRIVLEDDTARRQVRMSRDRSRVIRHFDDERSELRAVEALAREPGEIAGAAGAIARQIARDDLTLGFVQTDALARFFNPEDAVARGKLGQLRGRNDHGDVA